MVWKDYKDMSKKDNVSTTPSTDSPEFVLIHNPLSVEYLVQGRHRKEIATEILSNVRTENRRIQREEVTQKGSIMEELKMAEEAKAAAEKGRVEAERKLAAVASESEKKLAAVVSESEKKLAVIASESERRKKRIQELEEEMKRKEEEFDRKMLEMEKIVKEQRRKNDEEGEKFDELLEKTRKKYDDEEKN